MNTFHSKESTASSVYAEKAKKKWGYKVFALCDSSNVVLSLELAR
jgi:hypothetical protein